MSQSTKESSVSKFQLCTPLEALVLDLQVVSADLRGLQDMLSNIVRCLQELEVSVQVQSSRTTEV